MKALSKKRCPAMMVVALLVGMVFLTASSESYADCGRFRSRQVVRGPGFRSSSRTRQQFFPVDRGFSVNRNFRVSRGIGFRSGVDCRGGFCTPTRQLFFRF